MKKLPKVAIVGFPNVGKSTLFNRLLKEKKSLVHSLPGMTRDQVSSVCTLKDRRLVLTDTGGYSDSLEEPLSSLVKDRAREAADKANVLLFVLDGKRDLLPSEEELYVALKKLNKPILVVVNKVDSPSAEAGLGDFYRLGEKNILAVSAEHKRNLEDLEEALVEALPSPVLTMEETKPLRIAIVGRINVGKSSLINRLVGEERLIVSEIPGTTRDSVDTLIRRDRKAFCLVDTAGIRKLSRARDKREKASIIKARKNIQAADVVCLVMDAREFPTHQDAAVAQLAMDSGKPLVITLNKWDLVPKDPGAPEECRRRLYAKLEFVSYAPFLFVSALSGKGVVKILDYAEQVYADGTKRVRTSQLNVFLSWLNANHPLLSKKGRRIKITYMIQKGVLPPTFLLFTRSAASVAFSSRKFLTQRLREKFDIRGTPIRLIFRKS